VNEIPYGHTEAGAVVLEIGAGTGALVVRASSFRTSAIDPLAGRLGSSRG
jgi:precorrin-6B methylase 2